MKNELKNLKISDAEKVSFRVCLTKQYEELLRNEDKQTEELCLEAVSCDGLLLKYVKNQTLEMATIAIKQNKDAVEFVSDDVWEEYFNNSTTNSDIHL